MDAERVNPTDYSEHKPLQKWSETLKFSTSPENKLESSRHQTDIKYFSIF